MKPILILSLLFIFVVKDVNCQKLRIESNTIAFDSVMVLDYVLKGKEIDRSNRYSYQALGHYYNHNDTIIYQNLNWTNLSQPITVRFYNGVKPYSTQCGPNKETGIDIDQNTIYSSTPGLFNVIVTDSTGTRDSIYVNFYMPKAIDLTVCGSSDIDLSRNIGFFYSKELLISNEVQGNIDTVNSINDIPPLSIDQERIKLDYLDPSTLEKVHTMHIKITNLMPGDKCDDRNDCTYNDIVREDCTCSGTHVIDSLKIKVVYADACFSKNVTLYTDANNYEQYWSGPYLNGYGESINASIGKPTSINLSLKDDKGCKLVQEQLIFPKRQLDIKSNYKYYCDGEHVILSINDNEIFKKIEWRDEFANILDTVNTEINIQKPGKFTAFIKTDNCYRSGEIEVKSFSYVDYKINIENNYVCNQPEVLRITPPLDQRFNQRVIWRRLSKDEFESTSSNWEIVQENIDSLVISETGLYSLEVIEEKPHYNKSCKSYDQVVVYGDDSKNLATQYISYHLKYHEWKFKFVEQTSIPFRWTSEELLSKCSLVLNQSKNEIVLETLEDGKRFVLQEQFLRRLNRYGGLIGKSTVGHLIENDCASIKNIEKYLESIDQDSNRFVCIYYIDRTSTNSKDWVVYVYTKGEYGRFTSLID